MTKRVSLTLPDYLHEDLSIIAKNQGRTLANLANFLIEQAVMEMRQKGEFISDRKVEQQND